MKQIETIIYGGAFNPPTLAHEAILQACVDHASTVEADVWLLPSGDRIDKQIPVSRERRLGYIAAMIEDIETMVTKIEIVTSELDRTVAVETYDTVRELARSNPDRHFTWVFGADSTETMAEWKKGKWLLENLSMLVVERPGSVINPAARQVTGLSIPELAVSSTEVRQRLETGETVRHLVGGHVHKALYR